MKIRLKRSGGFAGNVYASMPPFEIDSSVLSPERAKELEEMVQAARLFDPAPKLKGPGALRDPIGYELTVEEGGRTNTIYTDDDSASEPLLSIIGWLSDREKEAGPDRV